MKVKLVKFSDKLDQIISTEAELTRLAGEFKFIEGPIWEPSKNRLIFSDIPANKMYEWSLNGGLKVFREPSHQSNGLTLDLKGRLLACEHKSRKVTLTGIDGQVEAIATHYEGKRLNSPNDIVVKTSGALYFTDPPYGLPNQTEGKELPFQGVYRLLTETKQLTLLVDDFERPNGLAFSPDEKVLYIDDSAKQHVRAFDVAADGTLTNDRLFVELDPTLGEGVPDGLKVDIEGNLYITGPSGIWIVSPEGEKLGVIQIPEVAANVGWGEADRKTLFITASTSLFSIRLNIPGC